MRFTKAPNLNHLWSALMVEELIRNGIDYFCISPGSRSSPLVCAAAENPQAKTFVHFDERGLAFHALGYTTATKKPCVLICTSGTAAANFFPAVIEASKKKNPLIILTADRPHELRFTGANQTIDQIKMFGDYARFFFDMPAPTKDIQPEFILTTIDQAVFRAQGELPGPVHLNCPFREPLAPISTQENFTSYLHPIQKWSAGNEPRTTYISPQKSISAQDRGKAAKILQASKKGLIAVGKLSSQKEEGAVLKLAQKLNWPIFPDITSGLRLGCIHPNVISYFDQILLSAKIQKNKPDCVLHLGGRMTSQRFYDYIERTSPKNYITVLNHPLRNDPLHKVTLRVQSKADVFCNQIEKNIVRKKERIFLNLFQKANPKVAARLDQSLAKTFSEMSAVRILSQMLPKDSGLFLASSLPIRYMDRYAVPNGNHIIVASNRGASGIDGTIASAVGFAKGLQTPTTLLIGDLAFLHDLNSLAMIKELKTTFVIVVLNNNGGGLFSSLPIARYKRKDIFTRFFLTPHGLRFERAAQLFKISYACPKNAEEFCLACQSACRKKCTTLIEIPPG